MPVAECQLPVPIMVSVCEQLLFCAITSLIWERNLPLNANIFYPMFANCIHVFKYCASTFDFLKNFLKIIQSQKILIQIRIYWNNFVSWEHSPRHEECFTIMPNFSLENANSFRQSAKTKIRINISLKIFFSQKVPMDT